MDIYRELTERNLMDSLLERGLGRQYFELSDRLDYVQGCWRVWTTSGICVRIEERKESVFCMTCQGAYCPHINHLFVLKGRLESAYETAHRPLGVEANNRTAGAALRDLPKGPRQWWRPTSW